MKNRISVSSSGPFLIELLIGFAVFALAAAICVQIFVGAQQISNESSNLNSAMIRAQSGAEIFKASGGDLSEVRKYFDSDWQPVAHSISDQHEELHSAEFVLTINSNRAEIGYIEADVVVSDMSGNVIFSLVVAALEVTP
jgi:type II secretory pathway pseudopilin PulG